MTENLGGHMILTTPPFRKKLRGHVQTVPGNMQVKFDVPSFESAVHLYALGVRPMTVCSSTLV